jgi:threonine synthase
MQKKYLPQGFFNVATFQDPGWRIEGKKTLGLELADPYFNEGQWDVPDVIIYPTGGGTGVLGMYKAFCELKLMRLIDRIPRFLCVQSANTAPLVEAWNHGLFDTDPGFHPGTTQAIGLNVPYGVGHFRVLEIIRKTKGAALAIKEQAMEEVTATLSLPLKLGPEGALAIAGYYDAVEKKLVLPGEKVVVINTGAASKYHYC